MKTYGGVTGIVNLSEKDGALYKRTLICHTGIFHAMYGPVEVTKDKLSRVAERYNSQHASVQTDADYAPILVDHIRCADGIKGRVMADLEVGPWTDPEDGTEGWGLYCTLRVEDEDAKNKVEGINGQSKKYAHVSMSFDDEGTYELFEVSFVAVEAARRSIVLSHGGSKMSLEAKLAAANKRKKAVLGAFKSHKAVSKAAALAASTNLAAVQDGITAFETEIKKVGTMLREKSIAAQFKSYVKEGRLSKADFDKLKIAEFAALPSAALSAVLHSYASRAVSTDVQQFGQQGAQPVKVEALSAAETRAMLKSGKKPAKLSAEEEDDKGGKSGGDDAAKAAKAAADEKDKSEGSQDGAKYSDIEECIKFLDGLAPQLAKHLESLKAMGDEMKKLAESSDKKDESEDGGDDE